MQNPGFTSDTADIRSNRLIQSDTVFLGSSSVCLVTSNVAFTRNTDDSVYFGAEATFPGYARKPVTLTDATYLSDGTLAIKVEPTSDWHPSNDTFGGASVFGAFIMSSDSVVLGKIPITPPVPLRNTLDTLLLTLAYAVPTEVFIIAQA